MRIAVLVSGGVDSSLALRLLHEQGYDVTAFYLKIWLEDELSFLGNCPWEDDLAYVRSLCDQLQVPLQVVPLQRAYWDRVVAYTVNEVKSGRTPNPDILCNSHVKFGAFFDAIGDTFDYVATGHYAQTRDNQDYVQLLQAPDPVKDQTYFLSYLNQKQLKRAWFPIGQYDKARVRELAHVYDIPSKNRKDSQGICFLGNFKFSDFLYHHVGEQRGDLIEYETGAHKGHHNGFWFYTIGQRRGIGLPHGPWYVVDKDTGNNIVYISRNYYADDKKRDTFDIIQCNWISGAEPADGQVRVKLRHGPDIHDGTLTRVDDDRYRITLSNRDQGIAPGQYAVCYRGHECIGAGMMTRVTQ